MAPSPELGQPKAPDKVDTKSVPVDTSADFGIQPKSSSSLTSSSSLPSSSQSSTAVTTVATQQDTEVRILSKIYLKNKILLNLHDRETMKLHFFYIFFSLCNFNLIFMYKCIMCDCQAIFLLFFFYFLLHIYL